MKAVRCDRYGKISGAYFENASDFLGILWDREALNGSCERRVDKEKEKGREEEQERFDGHGLYKCEMDDSVERVQTEGDLGSDLRGRSKIGIGKL